MNNVLLNLASSGRYFTIISCLDRPEGLLAHGRCLFTGQGIQTLGQCNQSVSLDLFSFGRQLEYVFATVALLATDWL